MKLGRIFCQNKNSLELLNTIFENSSLKGSLEQIKKRLNFCFCRRILENNRQPFLRMLMTVHTLSVNIVRCLREGIQKG